MSINYKRKKNTTPIKRINCEEDINKFFEFNVEYKRFPFNKKNKQS